MAEPLEATLRRLKQERDEADRRYNDALTALDRSLGPPSEFPAPPRPYDEHQISALNESWNILPAPPQVHGLKGKLAGFIWRVVAPFLQRQLTFNSQLVDHLNRNVPTHRDTQWVTESVVSVLREQFARQTEFQSRLLVYLQQITAYVDTKDRDTAGGALVLNESLSAMAENLGKRWESMAAREERREARLSALAAAQDDLRAGIGASQQAAMAVKREVERLSKTIAGPAEAATQIDDRSEPAHSGPAPQTFTSALDAYKYVGFEDQFRGSRELITARFKSYMPFFQSRSNVIDVGCGRGEFLDLLTERGIRARGVDLNPEMVEVCKERGLDVTHADAVGYLSTLQDGSVDGIFAAQVVEHLQPAYLLRFLDLCFQKMRSDGVLVLETLNPACWIAFFESYIRDITHVWPLHPETLKYLALASGFSSVQIEYRSPIPEQDRLQSAFVPPHADQTLTELAAIHNENMVKLNQRIFTYLDYAIVATT